jgi:hypothetical protein
MRVVDRTRHALSCIPRKGSMTCDTEHLVTPVDLRYADLALWTLFRVAAKFLNSRNIIRKTYVKVPVVFNVYLNGLMATMTRVETTTCTNRILLGDEPTAVCSVTRGKVFASCSFLEMTAGLVIYLTQGRDTSLQFIFLSFELICQYFLTFDFRLDQM